MDSGDWLEKGPKFNSSLEKPDLGKSCLESRRPEETWMQKHSVHHGLKYTSQRTLADCELCLEQIHCSSLGSTFMDVMPRNG
jgi:hypothetical protein